MAAISFSMRMALDAYRVRRMQRSEIQSRDDVIASLRLRLPPGSQMVTLEHQIFFNDDRNRSAAADVFTRNGFTVSTTAAHERRTKYWLLAVKSALIDRVPEDVARVVQFAEHYGGRYRSCNPQL